MKLTHPEATHMETVRAMTIAVLFALFILLTAGCERKIAQERHVDVDGSEVTTKEKTVTEKPNGNVNVTESEKTVDHSDGTVETETESKTYHK